MAGLLGLAPLAASSAALADAGSEPAKAPIELLPPELVPLAPLPPEAAAEPAPEPAAPPVPAPASAPISLGRGSASYYAAKFHGRRTASGEIFDNTAMTAAHRTLPFGTLVAVTNPATGKSVVVRINDRGPFAKGRVIDVSRAAAQELGLIAPGHAVVELALVKG